jgi:iron complex outermembrane receptor protein
MGVALAICDASGAQPAAPAESGDREIVVTARLRQEDVERVPVAVSVIGRDLLDQSYTVNAQQLTTLVPSLNYSSANPRNTALTIRGQGSSVVAVSQANDGLEPGVGFYVDGVYHARPATAAFDFTDIDRIEVLRGPQGTLFGKNTTAGAVNIVTSQPDFTPEFRGELSYGDFNFLQAKAAGSLPLVSGLLAVRVAALVTRRDGVIRNVVNSIDHNEIGNEAARIQFLLTPSPDLRIRLIADITNAESNCCTQVYLRVAQSLRPAARQYPALAAAIGYRPASTNPYERVTDIDAPLGINTNEGGVSLNSDLTAGPVSLTSITAWRFWNWDAANDRDYTGIPIQLIQHIPSRQDQFSQELRVASNGTRPVSYVAGLYYFFQRIVGRPISVYGPSAAYWLIGPTTGANATPVPANLLDGYAQDGRTRFRTDSYAVFGEANWHITPRLTLTGGVRYTYENKDANYATTVSGGLQTTNTALRNAQLSVIRPQAYTAKDQEDNVSGRANLSWQALDQLFLYGGWARGFKSGGINVSGLPLNAQNQAALSTATIRPELNTTYEGGIKSRLFARKLTLNLAGYYTEISNFQATVVDSAQTIALRGYLSNIPKVTVAGAEADTELRLGRMLVLGGSLAYADGRYARYPAGPCPIEAQTAATAACNLTGRSLAGLPRWSETLIADWAVPARPFGHAGRWFVHVDSNWRSGYNGDPSLSRATYIGAYNLTNAAAGFRSDAGWELSVFARNLFDADYIQNVTVQAGNSGLILGTPAIRASSASRSGCTSSGRRKRVRQPRERRLAVALPRSCNERVIGCCDFSAERGQPRAAMRAHLRFDERGAGDRVHLVDEVPAAPVAHAQRAPRGGDRTMLGDRAQHGVFARAEHVPSAGPQPDSDVDLSQGACTPSEPGWCNPDVPSATTDGGSPAQRCAPTVRRSVRRTPACIPTQLVENE